MVNQQTLIDLAILVIGCYFLAGGIFNQDWALSYRSGRVPEGSARIVIRVAATVVGIAILAGLVLRH